MVIFKKFLGYLMLVFVLTFAFVFAFTYWLGGMDLALACTLYFCALPLSRVAKRQWLTGTIALSGILLYRGGWDYVLRALGAAFSLNIVTVARDTTNNQRAFQAYLYFMLWAMAAWKVGLCILCMVGMFSAFYRTDLAKRCGRRFDVLWTLFTANKRRSPAVGTVASTDAQASPHLQRNSSTSLAEAVANKLRPPPLERPSVLSAVTSPPRWSCIKITWSPVDKATGYDISIRPSPTGALGSGMGGLGVASDHTDEILLSKVVKSDGAGAYGGGTSIEVQNLVANAEYGVRVRCHLPVSHGGGTGEWSGSVDIRTACDPHLAAHTMLFKIHTTYKDRKLWLGAKGWVHYESDARPLLMVKDGFATGGDNVHHGDVVMVCSQSSCLQGKKWSSSLEWADYERDPNAPREPMRANRKAQFVITLPCLTRPSATNPAFVGEVAGGAGGAGGGSNGGFDQDRGDFVAVDGVTLDFHTDNGRPFVLKHSKWDDYSLGIGRGHGSDDGRYYDALLVKGKDNPQEVKASFVSYATGIGVGVGGGGGGGGGGGIVRSGGAGTLQRTCSVPGHWTTRDLSIQSPSFTLRPVAGTEALFLHVKDHFERQGCSSEIVSIEECINPTLWHDYQAIRYRIRERNDVPGVTKIVTGATHQDYWSLDTTEKWLFHGTREEAIDAICTSGFDWRLSGSRTGAIYGDGAYFAVKSSYSKSYSPAKKGLRKMILSRVVTGVWMRGRSGLRRPDAGRDTSVDNIHNPTIFVVYDVRQAYPSFVITFK